MNKQRKTRKNRRYKGLTGYGLHLKRFEFSSKRGIRTIKFPLGEWDEKKQEMKPLNKVARSFAEKVKHDYEAMYGPLNLRTYVDIKKGEKEEIYSLRDFWVDCLRVGVIMKHTNTKLLNDVRVMEGAQEGIDQKQKELMKKINHEFYNAIDFEKFKKEVITKGEFRRGKKNIDIFVDKNSTYAKEKTKEILEEVVGKGQSAYRSCWEKYGVDFSLYKPASDDGIENKEKNDKPTFYIIPGVDNRRKDLMVIELIEAIEDTIKERISNKYTKVEEYIGLSDDFGGFSYAFNEKRMLGLLQNGGYETIKNLFENISSEVWKGKEKELRGKVEFLSEKANQLGKPRLANGWHNYRADIGGSLQSWLSNSFRQDVEIKRLLFGYENEDGKKIDGHIDNLQSLDGVWGNAVLKSYDGSDAESVKERIEEVKDVAKNMQNILEKMPGLKDKEKIENLDLENYRELLTQLCINLNFLYQEVYGEDDEGEETKKGKNKKPTAKGTFKQLFKNLPKIPSFIGDVKIKEGGVYDKYLDSLNRLRAGFDFLTSFQDDGYDDLSPQGKLKGSEERQADRVKEALQGLLRIYRTTDSVCARSIIAGALKYFYDGDLEELKKDSPYDYFFRNKRARETRGKELKIDDGKLVEHLPKLLESTKVNWQKYQSVEHWQNGQTYKEWVGLLEIQKVYIGLTAAFYDISAVKEKLDTLTNQKENHFPKIEVVFNRFKDSDKGKSESINMVIQQAVLSEMKGTVSKMSTDRIIARYVVQPQGVEKSMSLITDVQRYGENRKSGMKYYIDIEKSLEDDEKTDFTTIEKNEIKGDKKIVSEIEPVAVKEECLLPIQSSRFQTQFLDNVFSGRWEKYGPKLSSYSFIYEEYYKIEWSDAGIHISLDEEKPSRLFVSMPFELGLETNKERNKQLVERKNLLGVDIGEYGVALYLLDTENFKKSAYTRFFYDPTLRKIRESIKENKDRQRAGTFSIPNTYTKRLRDQAITRLRNKVHSVIVQNEAWPVYEKEVSAFESGSGKISKIYDSLKRSDVYSENSAEKMEQDLVWGKSSKQIGRDVGAYATSYMCSHCKQSIYAHISRDDPNYDSPEEGFKVKEVISVGKKNEGEKNEKHCSTVVFDIGGIEVYGYIERKDSVKKDEEMNGKEVISAAKKYARAKVKNILQRDGNSEFKKEFNALAGKDEDEKIEMFEKVCGTQAVYMCPFEECNKISDADIQAAMWIALKGYLNMLVYKGTVKELQKYWSGAERQDSDFDRAKWENGSTKEKIQCLLGFADKKGMPSVLFSFSNRPDIHREIKKEERRKKNAGKKK